MNSSLVVDTDIALKKLVEDKDIIIVSGGYFGDEAKGKLVALLADYADWFARVNGGENAGHTVFSGEKKYVFHLLPSGIISGKPTFIGSNCLMDPISFVKQELNPLRALGIPYDLGIGNSQVVMPWHKALDLAKKGNSSTGKGISFASQDVVAKRGTRLEDLLNKHYVSLKESFDFWKDKLSAQHDALLEILPNNYLKEIINSRDVVTATIDYFSSAIKEIEPYLIDVREQMLNLIKNKKKGVIEGPQSFFLSNQEPTHYKSSTSHVTSPLGILAATGLPADLKIRTVNVLKVPSSRVGFGANPAGYVDQNWFSDRGIVKNDIESSKLSFSHVYDSFINSIDGQGRQIDELYVNELGNEVYVKDHPLSIKEAFACASVLQYGEYGSTTGKPRVCGSLDLPHLAHLVKYQNRTMFLSRIDAFDNAEKIVVVDGYEYKGEHSFSNGKWYEPGDIIRTGDTLPDENILVQSIPIYEILSGWSTHSEEINSGDVLPHELEEFFNHIESKTNCNIIGFGTGPDTQAACFLSK